MCPPLIPAVIGTTIMEYSRYAATSPPIRPNTPRTRRRCGCGSSSHVASGMYAGQMTCENSEKTVDAKTASQAGSLPENDHTNPFELLNPEQQRNGGVG